VVASADNSAIQVRFRKGKSPDDAGVIIAINTSPRFVQTEIEAKQLPSEMPLPFEGRTVTTENDRWSERFPPYGVHVYVWGKEPAVELARERRG
jgi:hypothetical protein